MVCRARTGGIEQGGDPILCAWIESHGMNAGNINLRLIAIRRLAAEVADTNGLVVFINVNNKKRPPFGERLN